MISAIVVFHSDIARLLKTIESLAGQADEIVVIDVSPGSLALKIPVDAGIIVVVRPENLGYGWACNIGIASSINELVLISNSDVIYGAGSLALMAKVAATGHLCGPTQFSKGEQAQNIDAAESLQFGISKAASLNRWLGIGRANFEAARSEILLRLDSDIISVPRQMSLSGAALMASKQTWARLGGFDERFFLYQEDADLSVRAQAMNIPVSLVPKANVTHSSGTSRRGFDVTVLGWAITSEQLAWQAHGLPVALLKLIQILGLSVRVVTSFARLRYGDANGWAKALGKVVRQ